MKAAAFEELLTSVREAGEIRRGRGKLSRATSFKPADVKALRGDLGQSQVEFARSLEARYARTSGAHGPLSAR